MSWMFRLFNVVIVLVRNEYLYMSILDCMWASLSELWEELLSNGGEAGTQQTGTYYKYVPYYLKE